MIVSASPLLTSRSLAVEGTTAVPVRTLPPDWLGELSLGFKESYDDNILLVSGNGLPPVSSWVSDVSLRLGINLVPLLGDQHAIQTLSLAYQPELVNYANASSENYDAHRLITVLKGKTGGFSFSFDNSFLYNDGSKVAATYALNQLSGTAGNQNDKYRNALAHQAARERRNQIQDRYTAQLQYSPGNFFVRPVSSLTYLDVRTDLHNTSLAPNKGYQDYIDRYDVNGGVDFGAKTTPDLAVTLGYRFGYQHQDQYAPTINSDQHFSSGQYQRVLLGLEGRLGDKVTVKLAAGPEFRNYNANAPIVDPHTTRYYAEATVTAALAPDQSLNFNFKRWLFVSSTGLVPYIETAGSLTYHWNAARQLAVDVGVRLLEQDYTLGNDAAGSAPSLRDDIDYGAVIGASYAFSTRFNVSLTYNYDLGRNADHDLPASLGPSYRDFEHNVASLELRYKF